MKLIWHADGLLERDWLLQMFGDLITEEIIDLSLSHFEDNAIHVMSSNFLTASPARFDEYFRECRTKCRNLVLFHASDEFLSGHYELYRHFDHVIRTYQSYLTNHDSILTIPLGYPNGTKTQFETTHIASKYAWSFTGEFKASRVTMRRAFYGLEPKLLYDTSAQQISKDQFNRIMQDTIFAPCPMGNVMIETWRLYEALELGSIPLIERRWATDYYVKLLGINPIPAFYTWRAARDYAENLLADKHALLAKQRAIQGWWTDHKAFVRAQVLEAVTGRSRASELQCFAGYYRNRHRMIYQPLRAVELLRHQSIGSLWHRVQRYTQRSGK